MPERLHISTYDNKYTIIQEENGGMRLLRYGEQWSEPGEQIRYSNMILSLAHEIQELKQTIKELEIERDKAERGP